MNIVVKSALAGAALVIAYACANPVEIEGEVQRVEPRTFGDAGPEPASEGGATGATPSGAGGSAGVGSGSAGVGGSASGLAGGTGAGLGGASAGSGMQASASGPRPVGTGGSGVGVGGAAAQGGRAGASSGAGGVAGAPPAAAGTGGTPAGAAGTGATAGPAVFDAAECDFTDPTGCEDLTCQQVCPTNDGGSCLTRCNAVITCVSGDEAANPGASCITEADPLCAVRNQGTPKKCTAVVESAGGANPNPPAGNANPQPSFVARALVECLCSVPRP